MAEKTMKFGLCRMQARSIDFPNDPHPNKMPFTGIMTRIDEPSDGAPDGADGKRIMLTKEAAEKAIDSLFGMAVDFTDDWDGHDPTKKIGVITAAEIVDNAIHIGGFIWSNDFPKQAAFIKANKDKLGFSFEARDLWTSDLDADPVPICECVFTGAAVLFKDKAAYTTTSIHAKAKLAEATDISTHGVFIMDEAVQKQFDAIAASLAKVADAVASQGETIKKMNQERVDAANHLAKVEPHAKRLEDAADKMDEDGIGGHATRGHATVLRQMAASMRSEAAEGKMPHVYQGANVWGSARPAVDADRAEKVDVAKEVKAAADAVAKEMSAKFDELKAQAETNEKALKDQLAVAQTEIKDLKAKADAGKEEDAKRKTLSPSTMRLLAKAAIELPEGEGKLDLAQLDKSLKAAGLDPEQRMTVKTQLAAAKVID